MTNSTKKLTKKELKVIRINEIKSELKELLTKNNHEVYTELLHVSKSGMIRSIKVYTKDMTDITDMVAEIDDYTFHKTGGLKVNGCGMDMGFSVVYNLSVKLYCESGYVHDLAYKLKHKWI